MITILGNSGYTACLATGNIRNYSIVITAIGSLNFFLTWALYKMGCSVQITYYVYIAVYAIIMVVSAAALAVVLVKAKKNSIGSLSARESATCTAIVDGCYLLTYSASGTTKCGFVAYSGGVK